MPAFNRERVETGARIVCLTAFVLGLAAVAAAATWSNVTSYPVPTANGFPTGITAGRDGALWFTEHGKIGRLTTTGMFAEYPLPHVNSGPVGITRGPGGALWFAEYSASTIGRITPAGMITEYRVPTAGSFPNWITAGPDGALWFTEAQGNSIGRISIGGVIAEYRVPTADSEPCGITLGPDGALWFTKPNDDTIGRAPACGLGFSASFANGTLTMSFNLGIDTPATWFGSAHGSAGSEKQLWLESISAVVPPHSFTVTLGPGISSFGEVTIVAGLETASGEGLCYETAGVNTGQ